MLGLIALPIVFVWFLFLPGYSSSLRKVVLVYASIGPVLTLLAYIAGRLAE